jgi:hypothetical protein
LNSSQVAGNVAGIGGGITLADGTNSLVLNDSKVTSNMATTPNQFGDGFGGGILMHAMGTNSVKLYGSEISGNSAVGSGGGIQMNGTLTVGSDSQIFGNESGELSGDSQLSSLHVDSGGVLSTDMFGESLSSVRDVTIEGTLLSTVDSATKPLEAISTLTLAPGSVLRIETVGNLGSPGEHKLQIARARSIEGSFDATPQIGEHLGAGVFVAEHVETGSSVEYAEDQIWVNLFQATAGDANGDASVDFEDFLQLSNNFGKQQASWVDGDFDDDGEVAFADFLLLAAQFGDSDPQTDVGPTEGAATVDATFAQMV